MNVINRQMTNICSTDLPASKALYTALFDFNVDYDSDWFVHLISNDKQLELGIISQTSEIVPKQAQTNPQGFYITFVVASADTVYEAAKTAGLDILEPPADTFYGQRRMLLQDPNGVIVDVSSPIS